MQIQSEKYHIRNTRICISKTDSKGEKKKKAITKQNKQMNKKIQKKRKCERINGFLFQLFHV